MTQVLVTGGAGYIGSHMAKMLVRAGYRVLVLDDFSTGHRHLAKYGELIEGSTLDEQLLHRVFEQNNISAVVHFAAFSQVSESVAQPKKYFNNNVEGTRTLLKAMLRADVRQLVFSSTAAVYGEAQIPKAAFTRPGSKLYAIKETSQCRPTNPYGESKLQAEYLLADLAAHAQLKAIALRYFNAAGADPQGELGECHEPETHLIPLCFDAALGKRGPLKIYGTDYPTPDGTCIRDYVHVEDLCAAHLSALKQLNRAHSNELSELRISRGESANSSRADAPLQGLFKAYNLGNGSGYSVSEVITAVKEIIQRDGYDLPIEPAERRAGDPAILVADATLARVELGWQPKYPYLDQIIDHAWRYYLKS